MTKFIIDFKNDVTSEQAQAYLANLNCSSVIELSHYDKTFIVECESAPQPTDIVEHIIDDAASPISLLEYTQTFTHFDDEPTVTLDLESPTNWWKAASIFTPDFADGGDIHTVRGDKVNVYVVDSGIEATHPEFVGRTIENVYSFTGEYGDTRGHGTALASVISGQTCGLTNAKICVVKIFDDSKETRQSDLLLAFDAIIAHRTAAGNPSSVINLSWSIPKNEFIESKIQGLLDVGVFIVCSAGNSGIPIENVTPASMDDVTTIGSYNSNLTPSNFSNYSNEQLPTTAGEVNTGQLDGWGPGENIMVAMLGGGVAPANGTSIAAAIHSGALAYNAVEFLVDDDKMPNCLPAYNSQAKWANIFALTKENILTLSDKYAASVNRITSYRTLTGPRRMESGVRMKIVTGKEVCRKLFYTSVKSIHIENADALPQGLRLERSWIQGIVPEIEANAETHELFCTLELLNGETRQFTLFLGILNSNVNQDEVVPGEDPILDITLQVPQCCGPKLDADTCQGTTDECSSAACEAGDTFCDPGNPKDPQCICV